MRYRVDATRFLACLAVCLGGACPSGRSAEADWPMLAHDPARSGATTAEVRPPFERKWYRIFPDEGLMAGVQPIVAGGKVFVGTLHGTLHAIDAASGADVWAFAAGGPILHTAAAGEGKVFFGCADGKVYAVNAADGKLAWTVGGVSPRRETGSRDGDVPPTAAPTGLAVWNSPLVHEGTVIVGGRDGKLYAIEAGSGKVRWAAPTGGPLLCSPALDARAPGAGDGSGRVYIGSEDMHVYAFALRDGTQVWASEKLPGVSFRGYHPVVAPDGSVMIAVEPAMSLDAIAIVLMEMVREVFGDFANWRHSKEENARLKERNFKLMEKQGTYELQLASLRKRLAEEPALQTFFVLDPATGKRKFVAPIVYAESMNGPGAPPLVTPDGKVVVKFQALLRSRYGHYSPFLNVGYLDTASGHITPIMDQSRTYGWHDSLLLVHDEQCQLSVSGRVLVNAHQDNVNAMDLETLKGYGEPFCRNIHEPKAGEAIGIWAHILRGQPIPPGKEWLARGTAVYGGGSVIDVPVSVAGDSFYYVPTHEINAGAAVIAYRMKEGPYRPQPPTPPPAATFSDEEWKKVQQLPWDWDSLEAPRLAHVLKALAGKVPGTRQEPLADAAAEQAAKIAEAGLDEIIWGAPARKLPPTPASPELGRLVRELISQDWRPLVFPAGKHPSEAYRFFAEPTEVLYTLARAYPHLDAELQEEVKRYVAKKSALSEPLEGPLGERTFKPDAGAVRSAYDVPPDRAMRVADDILRCDVARLYPLWLWAHNSGDLRHIVRHWKRLRTLNLAAANRMEEDCRNGYVAGLIAYCRLAQMAKDADAVQRGVEAARKAIRDRIAYELAYPNGGLITMVPTLRSIFARWRHLTPEVGRLIALHARDINRHLMDVYVDYHRPAWWVSWNVELMVRNECPFAFPTMSAEIFAARALVLGEAAARLKTLLDLPWCKADLFYIQKHVLCIEADGETAWRDVRK